MYDMEEYWVSRMFGVYSICCLLCFGIELESESVSIEFGVYCVLKLNMTMLLVVDTGLCTLLLSSPKKS